MEVIRKIVILSILVGKKVWRKLKVRLDNNVHIFPLRVALRHEGKKTDIFIIFIITEVV